MISKEKLKKPLNVIRIMIYDKSKRKAKCLSLYYDDENNINLEKMKKVIADAIIEKSKEIEE